MLGRKPGLAMERSLLERRKLGVNGAVAIVELDYPVGFHTDRCCCLRCFRICGSLQFAGCRGI